MLANLNSNLDFHSKALVIRAERQRVIASNIANVDTPGYSAQNLDFKEAMNTANGAPKNTLALTQTKASPTYTPAPRTGHIALPSNESGQFVSTQTMGYTIQSQPSMDNNSVDLDQERSKFADNSVRYEATLRFINSHSKTILSAIQGQ
jgi:flagellar basal-body rod protein FlgB